jgi:hypothetical protein
MRCRLGCKGVADSCNLSGLPLQTHGSSAPAVAPGCPRGRILGTRAACAQRLRSLLHHLPSCRTRRRSEPHSSGSPLSQDTWGSGVLGWGVTGPGVACPKSRCWGCEPVALESESLPRCPPGPVTYELGCDAAAGLARGIPRPDGGQQGCGLGRGQALLGTPCPRHAVSDVPHPQRREWRTERRAPARPASTRGVAVRTAAEAGDGIGGYLPAVFLFFSNRLGCAGSLLLSLAVTAVLVVLLWR